MATFLYKLGRLAFRRRWYVALMWVAVLAAVGAGAATAPAAPDADNTMPGIESQKAFDLMDQRFPGSNAHGASARVVFMAPGGEKVTATENRAAIEKFVGAVAGGSQVSSTAAPFQAKAGRHQGGPGLGADRRGRRYGPGDDACGAAEALLAGIRTVASGDSLLSPNTTRTLITRFLNSPAPGTQLATPEGLAALTTREREVMCLAAEGSSNDEIAEKLYVSPLTIRTHVHRAMTKLGARPGPTGRHRLPVGARTTPATQGLVRLAFPCR